MHQPRAVSLEWNQSVEGQGILAHLSDPNTGFRKRYGLLERPVLPPTVQTLKFKLFLVGRAGVGKTALVSFLSTSNPAPQNFHPPGETPGVRCTQLYWPVQLLPPAQSPQIALFQLSAWDSGESAAKKYAHVQPVCRENASAAIFVFSFSDKGSFEDVEAQIARLLNQPLNNLCPIIVGTRFGALQESEVSQSDVSRFEGKYRVPVLRLRHFSLYQQRQQQALIDASLILNLICDQLYCHRQQRIEHPLL